VAVTEKVLLRSMAEESKETEGGLTVPPAAASDVTLIHPVVDARASFTTVVWDGCASRAN